MHPGGKENGAPGITTGNGVALCLLITLIAGCGIFLERLQEGEELSSFPHDVHARKVRLKCLSCHLQPAGARLPRFPDRGDCERCHDAEGSRLLEPFFGSGGGTWAHAGRQDEEIRFDHASHSSGGESECRKCHEDVAESWAIFSSMKMSMDGCVACHEKTAPEYLDCSPCHWILNRKTRPASHQGGWMARHGMQWRTATGRRTVDRCALCHDQGDCDDCHTTMRPRSHNVYWRGRGHGIASGIDRSRCFICHSRDVCDRCHSRIRPRNHTPSFGAPQNRHCNMCHLPLDHSDSCGVCHQGTPSHDF